MQQEANNKEGRVIDLREYRRRKETKREPEEATASNADEDILTKVAYYLLMASRAIAGQRKH